MARRRLWKQRSEQNIFGTGIRMRILLHKDTNGYVEWKYISFAEHVSNSAQGSGVIKFSCIYILIDTSRINMRSSNSTSSNVSSHSAIRVFEAWL